MKVSVCIPVSNDQRPNALRNTVQSAKEGIGDLDHEIIVCDDQSVDGCTRGLPRDVLVVRTKRRMGCTGSRKVLEQAATGDVTIWSDAHCRYPVDGLKKMAIAAYDWAVGGQPGIIMPMTRTMVPGSRVGYGGKWEINERGIAVPKATVNAHPTHPGLVGAVYALRRDVLDKLGGWPHLPGFWGCADTTFGLIAWCLGAPTVVVNDVECIHRYSPDRRFCFSMKAWGHAANAHWMHRAAFPASYKTYWRPLLMKHPRWGTPKIMGKVDETFKYKRFRQLSAFVSDNRLPNRDESACFKALFLKEPPESFAANDVYPEDRELNRQSTRVINTGRVQRAQRKEAFEWLAGHNHCIPVTAALDIGTGDGIGMELISQHCPDARVYGVDLIRQRVESAKAKGLDVRVGDAEALPFMDDTFELVTSMHVLEHCPAPARAMSEIERVLKPGGQALVIVPREQKPKWEAHLCCFPREKDVVHAVSQSGLEVVDVMTRLIHNRGREIRVVAQKLAEPYSDYVAQQVKIAPGHREHKFVREERLAAMDWLVDHATVSLSAVLDVGPRDCFIMNYLAGKTSGTVRGIEVSPPAARTAREQGHDVIEGDVRQMPYEDGEFSFVNCLHVLEHCPQPGKAIAEMWRCVRPGGHMYIVVPVQSGEDGTRRGAHYSYFDSEEALCDSVVAAAPGCEVQSAIGVIKNGVKEIRLVAQKGTAE